MLGNTPNIITKLTLKDYQEITVKKVKANQNSRLLGIHHFSLGEDSIYIDKLFKFNLWFNYIIIILLKTNVF